MLKRISKVQGVGLLHGVDGRRYGFEKGTLVYAENGRGKSTLASVLRSVSTGDPDIVHSRTTVGSTVTPEVELQFDSGHRVTLQSGIWSESRPELLVFDADFIERNVHSGGAVSPTQRKNLLEFALGEGAVEAQAKLDEAKQLVIEAAGDARNLEGQLSGHHAGVSLEVFHKLVAVEDPEGKVSALRKRLDAATSIVAIKGRPVPSQVQLPSLDLDALFMILGTSLQDIHADAERVVREHIDHIGDASAEQWISQGQPLEKDENCPYCGQSLDGVELIQAYRTFFNRAYHELKRKVAVIEEGVSRRTSDSIIDSFAANVATSQALATSWQEQADLREISFDNEQALEIMSRLRELLQELARSKAMNLTGAVGTEAQKAEAAALWKQLLELMQQSNLMIEAATTAINAYKQQLDAENPDQLSQEMLCIQLADKRHSELVVELFSALNAARIKHSEAEGKKRKAKIKLDAVMQETLSKYERAINQLLARFGASFSIHQLSTNHRGGAPRTEYGLLLRGQAISIDKGTPSFATALSEGDKRTLAFAFFVASVLADQNLAQKVVVIDDPMCSLDLNRKQQTRRVLKEIYNRSEQLVVLAHDLYFLRDFRDDLAKEQEAFTVLQMKHSAGRYTDFGFIDLDIECASRYYRDHKLLSEFVCGQSADDSRLVAKAIRPMLEGYLHRRFPGLLPKGQMFGSVVALIRDADQGTPLFHAQCLVDELNDINSYAGLFHHNTNPDADSVDVVDGELVTYASRALDVVYQGTAP